MMPPGFFWSTWNIAKVQDSQDWFFALGRWRKWMSKSLLMGALFMGTTVVTQLGWSYFICLKLPTSDSSYAAVVCRKWKLLFLKVYWESVRWDYSGVGICLAELNTVYFKATEMLFSSEVWCWPTSVWIDLRINKWVQVLGYSLSSWPIWPRKPWKMA